MALVVVVAVVPAVVVVALAVVAVALVVVVVSLGMIIYLQIIRFRCLLKRRYGWTDGWIYRPMDRPSYRDARTHLKHLSSLLFINASML